MGLVKGMEAMVVGYDLREKDGRNEFTYTVVPFPLGCVDGDSLKRVPAEELQPLRTGFEGEAAEIAGSYMDMLRQTAEKCSYEEMQAYLRQVQASLAGGEKENG